MFSKPILNFIRNLSELREFIELVADFIDRSQKDRIKDDARNLIPILLAFKKLDPKIEEALVFDSPEEEIKAKFGAEFNIEVKDGERGKSVTIQIDGHANERFEKAVKRFFTPFGHRDNLFKSGLVSLISYVEWFLSSLIHQHYENRITDAHLKDKVLSFDDLKKINSVDDARKFLVDKEVEGVLRGDVDDWIAYLKSKLHLSMGYLEEIRDELTLKYPLIYVT